MDTDRRLPCLALLAAALALPACRELTIEAGGPLRITLRADREVADVGQRVRFDFAAEGTYLRGIVVTYGDGAADSVIAYGARTATSVLDHAYSEAGEFTVRARAEEAEGGTATDSVRITIVSP